ncbi:hypothetical protein K440DRAFT_537999 [Wilcoxina mikolae CBS 423.85]|nr:hypothetical protein K440DRAFT_537999 [Wilcoxina mikolae CBS 423.85]
MADTFQESLPDRSTVFPDILSSDKTILSTLSCDKSAWPVILVLATFPRRNDNLLSQMDRY